MNRSAFEHGLRCELEKLAIGGGGNFQPTQRSAAPTPVSTAPRPPQVDRGDKTLNLAHEQNIAQEEAKNVPSTWNAYTHDLASPGGIGRAIGGGVGGAVGTVAGGVAGAFGGPAAPVTIPAGAMVGGAKGGDLGSRIGGGLGDWMSRPFAKSRITSQIQGTKPGEVVKPMSQNQMLDHDTILNDPALMAHAKEQAALKSQQVTQATPREDLSDLASQYKGPNDPLHNALHQHIANDPENLKALSGIVGNKTYGAFGVGTGLQSKFTPGNFQFGNFLNDHWGKLLGGGGLLAALMYALKGNGDDEHKQQGPVINNYMGGMPMGGQPQFSRLPGYGQ